MSHLRGSVCPACANGARDSKAPAIRQASLVACPLWVTPIWQRFHGTFAPVLPPFYTFFVCFKFMWDHCDLCGVFRKNSECKHSFFSGDSSIALFGSLHWLSNFSGSFGQFLNVVGTVLKLQVSPHGCTCHMQDVAVSATALSLFIWCFICLWLHSGLMACFYVQLLLHSFGKHDMVAFRLCTSSGWLQWHCHLVWAK